MMNWYTQQRMPKGGVMTRRGARTFVAALAAVGLVTMVAGCGDDDDSASTATTAAAATTTAAAVTTTAAGASTGASTTAAGSATTGGATGDTVSKAEWDKVIADAKKEGGVTIYSSQGLDQLNKMGEDFKTKYGIPVTVVRAIDSDIQAKVQAEADSNKPIADVVVQATLQWQLDKSAAGAFAKVNLPGFSQAGYNRAMNVSENSDYFVVTAAILTFGWNTELWPDGLKDYPDLLNPGLQGKVGVIEPSAASIVDFYLYLEDQFGSDFIDKLAAQKPKIYPSSLPMGQALSSGEIAAGSFVQVQTDAKASGAPVDSGLSKTVWGAIFNGAVMANAPHPNAAKLLADFVLSPQGQEDLAHLASAALPDIPGTAGVTTDSVHRQDLSKLTPDAVAAFQARWKSLFQG
jgi:iron(III) transport system substrate-binding protein